jgi:hypothetical protein
MRSRPRPELFLIGTGLAVAVLSALLIGSFRMQYGWHTVDSAERCRSIQEKVDFGHQLSSPKIVFIGGSSVHWGINAEKAGKALHREGLNFGTFAALGPEVILWEARRVLSRGDIAVLAFEYSMYTERSLTADAISYALGCDTSFLTAMRPLDFIETALASDPVRPFQVLWWWMTEGKDHSGVLTSPLARSRHGDPVPSSFQKMDEKAVKERVKLYRPLTIRVEENNTIERALKSFVAWAHQQDVKVYVTWPNTIAFDAYKGDQGFAEIRALYARQHIPIVGEPTAAMYSAEMFYDTHYHLSVAGIERRTQDLLVVLKQQLESDSIISSREESVATPSSARIIGTSRAESLSN